MYKPRDITPSAFSPFGASGTSSFQGEEVYGIQAFFGGG